MSNSTRSKQIRLDKIPAGSIVTFRYRNHEPERAFFSGIKGSGDSRRALFTSRRCGLPVAKTTYDWEAYRYNGYWALGSSADRMRILDYEEVL